MVGFTIENIDTLCVRAAAVARPPARLRGFSGFLREQISLFSTSSGANRTYLAPLGSDLDRLKRGIQTGKDCMGPFPPGRPP